MNERTREVSVIQICAHILGQFMSIMTLVISCLTRYALLIKLKPKWKFTLMVMMSLPYAGVGK